MHYGYIYKIINTINDTIYIGKRKRDFDPKYLGSGIAINNAINKYGKDKFTAILLCYCNSLDELNDLERLCISEYRDMYGKRSLYNIADGGDGGCLVRMFGESNPMYKLRGKNSPFYIEKDLITCPTCGKSFEKRKASNQKYCSMKCGKKNKCWVYDTKTSTDHFILKDDLEKYLQLGWERGRGDSFRRKCAETKFGVNNPMFGKKLIFSEEHRKKLSQSNKGKKKTAEQKEKNRLGHLGKPAWNKGMTKSQMEEYRKKNVR